MDKLRSEINAMETNASLREEKNFSERMEAIDFIDFYILTGQRGLASIRRRAEQLKAELEEIDRDLFEKLRCAIRTKEYTGLEWKRLIGEYVDADDNEGYDNLDMFVNGLTSFRAMPEVTKDLESEMVPFQKTPARIVFELAERVNFSAKDVFVDVGAGLGQVAILVNLLTGVPARGIEVEPAFCAYARASANELHLSQVTFINVDARSADYSEGTVFFMYTPFKGDILDDVLDRLRRESLHRTIKVVAYGPCMGRVAQERWLDMAVMREGEEHGFGIFGSWSI